MDSAPASDGSGAFVGNTVWPLTPEMLAQAAHEDAERAKASAERHQRLQQKAANEQARRRKELRSGLAQESPDATASEHIATDLAVHEALLAERLGALQFAVADRLETVLDNPRFALAMTKALLELTQVRALTTKRAERLLETASNLRIARRFQGVRGLA